MRCRLALAVAGLLAYLVPVVCAPAAVTAAEAADARKAAGDAEEAKAKASKPPPPPLKITEVSLRPPVGRVLERLEVAIAVDGGPFENPDDPAEIDVRAVVEPPGGEPVSVPAFWYRDHRVDEGAKRIVPEGEPGFRVRYTPLVPGNHTWTVRATAGKRKAEAAPVTFQVLKAEETARGFLRLHETNPTYYQEPRTARTVFLMGCRLDGHQFGTRKVEKAYGAAGFCDRENGIDPAGLYATWDWYVTTVDALADAGATCVRLPLHSWYLPLEAQGEKTWIPGLSPGRYHAGNAWVADRIIERCAARGLAVIPVTWNYDPVTLRGDDTRPYAVYGKHKALTLRRLRYQVARWSYSPAVLGWTLFDNAHFRPTGSDYWTAVVRTIREMDPNPHFVFNTPYGVDMKEYLYPNPYGYPLADFYEGEERPYVVTGYGTPEHAERLARAGLWAAVAGHRAGAIYLHAWHLRQAQAIEQVYRPTAAMLDGVDFGAHAWRKAYFDKVTGPSVHHYGMVGDKERALLFFMRTSAHHDEAYGPLRGVVMRMGDFRPGPYAIEWWKAGDTKPFERATVRCADETVLLSVPDGLRWHWAATIVPAEE
ncbi:MAG: hypothetical protein R6X20_18350 [Phycisphaerae bacterium]